MVQLGKIDFYSNMHPHTHTSQRYVYDWYSSYYMYAYARLEFYHYNYF